jgi:hypothetical protein
MRKFTHLDSLDRPRKRRSRAPLIVLLLMALVATPPAYEFARLKLAEYRLLGFSGAVDTPLLTAISHHWEYGRGELRDWATPLLVNRRWSPQMVLPIAFFWTGVAAFMLRKGH